MQDWRSARFIRRLTAGLARAQVSWTLPCTLVRPDNPRRPCRGSAQKAESLNSGFDSEPRTIVWPPPLPPTALENVGRTVMDVAIIEFHGTVG